MFFTYPILFAKKTPLDCSVRRGNRSTDLVRAGCLLYPLGYSNYTLWCSRQRQGNTAERSKVRPLLVGNRDFTILSQNGRRKLWSRLIAYYDYTQMESNQSCWLPPGRLSGTWVVPPGPPRHGGRNEPGRSVVVTRLYRVKPV